MDVYFEQVYLEHLLNNHKLNEVNQDDYVMMQQLVNVFDYELMNHQINQENNVFLIFLY